MWRKNKNNESAAEKEAVKLFTAMERWRNTVLASHQMVVLFANDLASPGWTPQGEELVKFRDLLVQSLSAPPVAPPKLSSGLTPFGTYKGFFLADPFENREALTLEDIPDFASPRPFFDIYTLREGLLNLSDSKDYYAARELEEWIKERWLFYLGSLATNG